MLIDQFTPDWLDHLDHRQADAIGDTQLFLLIDGAFLPDFYRAVRKALPDDVKVLLLFESLPGCTDKTRSVSPFLLPYLPVSTSLKRVLDQCSGWPMVSAIETTETLEELCNRLSAWCIIEHDQQRFNFRFPDTRRLPVIFDSLSLLQRGSMIGPALRWSYIGRNGEWCALQLPRSASPLADRPLLDDVQFALLVSDSEIDEIFVLLQDRGPLPERRPSETYCIVHQARNAATHAGFHPNLLLDWCKVCVEHPEHLNNAEGAVAALAWRACQMQRNATEES